MKRFAVALLCLALCVGSSIAAQGDVPGLSAADLALLAAANSAALDSFAFEYTARFAVEGLDTFAVNADLSGTGAVDRTAHALGVALSGQVALGAAQVISVNEELRWVDDTLYLNAGEGWQAHDGASEYASELVSQYAFVTADAAALSQWDLSGIDGWSAVLTALTSVDPASFLTAQRLADEAVGAVQTAHFQVTADLHALMQTDAFVDAVMALANTQGTMLVIYDHDEIAGIIRANSAMFENARVTLDQYVGLEDGLPHRVLLTVDVPVDPTKGGYPNAAFNASATLDITLTNINQPQSISAPDGAQPVSDFEFPAPPTPAPSGEGVTQYVYFDYIGSEGDSYIRSFEAKAGDTVTITASGLSLEADTKITLIAPDGTTLAENDDRETPSFALGDYESQIVGFAIPEDGTYGVQVIDAYGGTGTYVLSIVIER